MSVTWQRTGFVRQMMSTEGVGLVVKGIPVAVRAQADVWWCPGALSIRALIRPFDVLTFPPITATMTADECFESWLTENKRKHVAGGVYQARICLGEEAGRDDRVQGDVGDAVERLVMLLMENAV